MTKIERDQKLDGVNGKMERWEQNLKGLVLMMMNNDNDNDNEQW